MHSLFDPCHFEQTKQRRCHREDKRLSFVKVIVKRVPRVALRMFSSQTTPTELPV